MPISEDKIRLSLTSLFMVFYSLFVWWETHNLSKPERCFDIMQWGNALMLVLIQVYCIYPTIKGVFFLIFRSLKIWNSFRLTKIVKNQWNSEISGKIYPWQQLLISKLVYLQSSDIFPKHSLSDFCYCYHHICMCFTCLHFLKP
jgi:hypothetical protein